MHKYFLLSLSLHEIVYILYAFANRAERREIFTSSAADNYVGRKDLIAVLFFFLFCTRGIFWLFRRSLRNRFVSIYACSKVERAFVRARVASCCCSRGLIDFNLFKFLYSRRRLHTPVASLISHPASSSSIYYTDVLGASADVEISRARIY